MQYRREIDGLRALAVIPVLLFHAGIPYLNGGYLGVDVFFVISGFLITKIIIDEIANKQFSLFNFYERRARRILPALFLVIVCTALFLPLFSSSPNILKDFGESAISVSLFASNIYFYLTSGYFGDTSELSPLLHTWSLAVEEQFYLFFPILAMIVYPFDKKYFVYSLVFFTLLSLIIAEWGWRNSPTGNFYLIPSRTWELLFGSFGAILVGHEKLANISDRVKSSLSIAGLLMVLGSYFLFIPETPHPSILTIIPVLGSLLIILFASERNYCGQFLQLKLLVHIGLVSYSLYLWHQPIFALVKLKTGLHLSPTLQILLLLLTYILSYLTWRFVEAPFRNKRKFKHKKIFILSTLVLFLTLTIGLLFYTNSKWQKLFFPEDMKRYSVLINAHNAHKNQKMYSDECKIWSSNLNKEFKEKFSRCSQKYGKAIFIIGGSHGMDLYNTVASSTLNKFVASISRGFCRAHDFIGQIKNPPKCQYEELLTFLEKNTNSISSILYTQTPDRLFATDMHSASENDLSIPHVDQVVNYLDKLSQRVSSEVIMIGMLPPMEKPPIKLLHTVELKPQIENNISQHTIALTQYVDEQFSEKLAQKDIIYISKFEGFNLNLPKDFIHNDKLTYSDQRHLSDIGEKIFGSRLVKHLYTKGFKDFTPITNK